jgi:pyrroline-5-carboxylate reductase
MTTGPIAILGGGNLGRAIAEGLLSSARLRAQDLFVTRRHPEHLAALAERGVTVGADNASAVRDARVVLLTVDPHHVPGVLAEIAPALDPARQLVVSCATGVGLDALGAGLGWDAAAPPLFLAMPNTAVAVRASMTCVATRSADRAALAEVCALFETVGEVEVIDEELIPAATVLAACGIAYSLRFVRAASQGGTEIGFGAEISQRLTAQTVHGASQLLLSGGLHPEREIDRVTTPRGCTIAGLNEMEHRGFSSAVIKGIAASFAKIARIAGDTP